MKLIWKLVLLLIGIYIQLGYVSASDRDSVLMYHIDTLKIKTDDFNVLFVEVTKLGNDDEEKLRLFYYWVFKNISFDFERFNRNSTPLDLETILKNRKGLCTEYSLLMREACNKLKLLNVQIEGYVKFYGFVSGTSFKEPNHIWNAIKLDKSWKLIDLLWSCGTMSSANQTLLFNKKLMNKYFLADPKIFIDTHIPADPMWQFKYYPYKIEAFLNSPDEIDTSVERLPYMNYKDSIQQFLNLSEGEQLIRSGERAYGYNKENCRTLAINYYNVAVDLVNKKTVNLGELILARTYLIKVENFCKNPDDISLQELSNLCDIGLNTVEHKLSKFKNNSPTGSRMKISN